MGTSNRRGEEFSVYRLSFLLFGVLWTMQNQKSSKFKPIFYDPKIDSTTCFTAACISTSSLVVPTIVSTAASTGPHPSAIKVPQLIKSPGEGP
jgi:hypothetical protein